MSTPSTERETGVPNQLLAVDLPKCKRGCKNSPRTDERRLFLLHHGGSNLDPVRLDRRCSQQKLWCGHVVPGRLLLPLRRLFLVLLRLIAISFKSHTTLLREAVQRPVESQA